MRQGFDYELLKSIVDQEFDFITHFPLVKSGSSSDGRSGDRIVYLDSSNERLDLQGDIVSSAAIKKSLNFYLKFGKIDYDHKSLVDPRFLIGEPIEGRITESGNFIAKGRLYKGMPIADTVWDLIDKAKANLGVSIGGKILKSQEDFDRKYNRDVNRVISILMNHLAITPYPINVWTAAKSMPWGDFLKSLTGGDVDEMTTGTAPALLTESLERSGNKELKRKKHLKKILREFVYDVAEAKAGYISPYVRSDGTFPDGHRGARRHFMEHMDLDINIAEKVSAFVIRNQDDISELIVKAKQRI